MINGSFTLDTFLFFEGNHFCGPHLFITHHFVPAENILVVSSLQMSFICALNEVRDLITSPKENCGLVVRLWKSLQVGQRDWTSYNIWR